MAIATSSLLAGFSALSAGMSVMGGMQQKSAADQQATNAMASAELRGKEQARQTSEQAVQAKQDAESFRKEQKLRFLKSGVSLEGSPFLAMEETRRRGQENVNQIIEGGASGVASTMSEGRTRASSLKQSGRTAFMSGITNAIGTGANYYANK